MLHSDIGLFGRSSDSWDTNCARKFLLIPEEELKKLDSIPGWSTREQQTNKKLIVEQGKSIQIVERPLHSQFVKTANHPSSSIQNTNISEKEPPRKKSKISTPAENQFFENISLCSNKEVEGLSIIPIPKDCSSTPGIDVLEEVETVRQSTSLEHISCNMSTEQHTLSQPNKSVEKLLLDTTYVIPSVLDDKTNDIQVISDVQSQKTSSPVKIFSKKRTLETEISNQPLPDEPVPKFGGVPVFPTIPVSTQVSHENFLSKKLRLLEKRFSPSKEFSLSPSQETIMAKVNLENIESQNLPKATSEPIKVADSQANIRSQVNVEASLNSEDGKTSLIANISSSEKATTKKRGVVSEAELLEKECTEVASIKSNVFEEESFVSQPIPCGQPPSNSHLYSSSKPPGTHSAIKCQVVKPSVNENMAEKANMPSCVLSEKCSGQGEVQELVSVKGSRVGRKRKLKSKGENTSRKSLGAKPIVFIQYTAEQIRNMVEILKHFQSEM